MVSGAHRNDFILNTAESYLGTIPLGNQGGGGYKDIGFSHFTNIDTPCNTHHLYSRYTATEVTEWI